MLHFIILNKWKHNTFKDNIKIQFIQNNEDIFDAIYQDSE